MTLTWTLLWIVCLTPSASAESVDVMAAIEAGRVALRAGRFADALTAFAPARRRLDEVTDRAGLLGNVARCFEALGRPVEARATFREARRWVTRDPPPSDDPRDARLRRLDRHIARVEGLIARVEVRCDIEGADVAVTGGDKAPCPATFDLDPGSYHLTGRAGRGEAVHHTVALAVGERRLVEMTLHSPELLSAGPVEDDDGATWPWVAVGVGAGVVVTVGVALLVARETTATPRSTFTIME